MTMELESQVVVLRLLAFAAAVVVATNRQDRWGIVLTLIEDRYSPSGSTYTGINELRLRRLRAAHTAVYAKKLVSKHWLHHMGPVHGEPAGGVDRHRVGGLVGERAQRAVRRLPSLP
ncbi:hypothetical protein ZEAMMB73_Zm00001d031661 [Zea mays]|uniref:Uncharacterized protein n=1 Tax=Zea mays TaxID=4577 RepID=A0A1D6KKF1_MAIZE|nr:hypothetical protein ZEAMMB73_Zm00001d031661 [Zea mays]